MSQKNGTSQGQTMEASEEGELEDGEIEDETGSENDHFVPASTPTCPKKHIPSLMSVNVAQKTFFRRGDPPRSSRYFPRPSSNYYYRPQGGKYPASSAGGTQMLDPLHTSKTKRSLESREFGGGIHNVSSESGTLVKRRREMSKDVEDILSERRLPRSDSVKQTRQLSRKRTRRRPHAKEGLGRESRDSRGPSEQDEYEALLRKHHEVQELIKQEEEKLTSERGSLDGEGRGREKDLDGGETAQGPSKRPKSRSRSRSGSLKEEVAPTQDTTVEDSSDAEIVEVKNQANKEIIEIPDDDEDDDELLQLRRLALESATKNVAAREEKENKAHKHRADRMSESKRAKQRERRQKVKQLFHKQSIAAEIFKVHGEQERFTQFMDFIMKQRRSATSTPGKSARRSPSVVGEFSQKDAASSSGDAPREFQYDNYEEVEMEVSEMEESPSLTPVAETLDLTSDVQAVTSSDPDAPSSTSNSTPGAAEAAATGNKEDEADAEHDKDEEEEDVMALREQLLRSLATKRAARAQAKEQTEVQQEEYTPEEPSVHGPTYHPSPIQPAMSSMSTPLGEDATPTSSSPKVYASPLSTPRTQSPTTSLIQGLPKQPVGKAKPKVALPAIPTHKPVVIKFDGDSDSSEDELSPQKPQLKQINFLDQFLKEARRTADAKKSQAQQRPAVSQVPKTPDAMHSLPEVHRAEYQKLKEEIARREQQRLGRLAAPQGTSPGTQSPIRDVTISVTKVDGQEQRMVVLKNPKAKEAETTQAKEKVLETQKDTPQSSTKHSPEVLERQANLTKYRLTAEKDCRILTAVERQLQKRQLLLKQTEARLQQLRDELAVGERLAASHRTQIKKYVQQKHLLQRKVQEHLTKETALIADLAKSKGVPVTSISQSPMLLEAASRLPLTGSPIGGRPKLKSVPNSPMLKKPETELQRLQRLEREYAKQISKLREANSRQAAKRANPVPNAVVQFLKTKTKLLNQKPSTQLLTKDKIAFGGDTPTNTDSESDAEKYLRSRKDSKRRRSFLDDNPSLRPNLLARTRSSQPPSSKPNHSQDKSIHNNSRASSDHVLNPTDSLKSSTSGKANGKAENQKNSSQSEASISAKPLSKIPPVVEGMSLPGDEQVARLRCAHAEKAKAALGTSLLAAHFGLESDAAAGLHANFSRRTSDVKMSIIKDTARTDQDEDDERDASLAPYTSPLLCFRSYRLSPFFVKEAKFSRLSPSFSHKLDPTRALCQFELNGTCNDDDCPWQHQKDYELSDHEIYADILAYTPVIAASRDWQDPEKRLQRVEDYVNKAVKNSKRPETAKRQREALCRAFANAVLTQTKKGSKGVIAQPRAWTPRQTPADHPNPVDDDIDLPTVPRGSKPAGGLHVVPLGGDNSERYYTGEGILELEAAVLENPGDVDRWIKLAARIIGDETEDQDIDRGLNALSRGLESNQSSSELWLQYLLLYSQREDHGDLSELCQQALQFAPSYDLYWQCLSFEESFPSKDSTCERMLAFVQSQQAKEMTAQGSHRLLEALLYRVQLYVMTRRVKASLSMLQGALRDRDALLRFLTPEDRCLAWLVYIHMLEYQRLPSHLFDCTGSGLGHIVSKKPLIFQWGTPSAIQSAEGVRAAFQEALSSCRSPDRSEEENVSVCMPLYRNLVILEKLTGRLERAQEICEKLLADVPANSELWLLLTDVLRQQGSNKTKLEQAIKNALKSCPRSAALYNMAAMFALPACPKAAITALKLCAFAFHSIPDRSAYESVEQIRGLYCSLLGQGLPFDYTPPKLRPGIVSEVIRAQSRHLWLNYCLLQELTADDTGASEAYEKSLCHLRETEDAQRLWMEYLLFRKSKLPTSQDKLESFSAFTGLVNRCLVSMATEFPLPHSNDKMWLDFSFHNQVVELYIGCLKDGDCLDMYERFINQMPSNVHLALRACQFASKSSPDGPCLHRVKAIATDILNKFPECLPFWKIIIALSLHRGRLKEAKTLYRQALEAVPLAANLWKDFFLLEVVHDRNPEDIRKLVLTCRELKVNIEDYLKTILK
ncbi:zinc finger C3H1 domain-containing protein-like isoform X2 [Acanthaster planci]|uniref:Zinc finger C3H1 domain-containing protein-like isoform X2 n=1 Tax=Acanthaster planci TaxID=133434 RepID=A0A8B7YAT9_ACAPL|nr:zinc finger C3H1 domain-containing protein-like isoform X2 [Acanthaster planci]